MRRVIFLSYVLSTLLPLSLLGQEMVESVRSDGLNKTISYNVSKFTDVRDKKLEDVLSKMPGISRMSWEGYVGYTYNGISIDKFYVNGMDILEGNYLPVYNLRPEDVDRVEILENHVDVMILQGMKYSGSVAANVVLKTASDALWSGTLKAGSGFYSSLDEKTSPLYHIDASAVNISSRIQSTFLLKTDNTGLNLSPGTVDFGDYPNYGPDSYDYSGLSYTAREFLQVEPSLAPLSSERVRFNNSLLANAGTSFKISKDCQLNLQMTFHRDRLKASSFDETTYYLEGGGRVVDMTGEYARSSQNDLVTGLNLLSNTDDLYLSDNLSVVAQWRNVEKDITGSYPNLQSVNTKPLKLNNTFVLKRHAGRNIAGFDLRTTYMNRPQSLGVEKPLESYAQRITSRSFLVDAAGSLTVPLDRFNLALRLGIADNTRKLGATVTPVQGLDIKDMSNRVNVLKAYSNASLNYISDDLQVDLSFPLGIASYRLSSPGLDAPVRDSKWFFTGRLSAKYEVSPNLSVSLNGSAYNWDVDATQCFNGLVLNDYQSVTKGMSSFLRSTGMDGTVSWAYRNPVSSVFFSGSLSTEVERPRMVSHMDFTEDFIISCFQEVPASVKVRNTRMEADVSKGIGYLKGKVGLSGHAMLARTHTVRMGNLIPYSVSMYILSPYVDGKLFSWLNAKYRIDFEWDRMRMSTDNTSSRSKGYTQTLELIFSPLERFNFSLLGEHYYTEFTDDVSKHLIISDLKAEYTITGRWQLLLAVTNLLNQKTYNYTLLDGENFSKSFTSYRIRPRNVLLSLYWMF